MTINIGDIMKNMQQIQSQMGAAKEQLERISVTGSAGGDMVTIEINGLFEVQAVRIDPSMVNPSDVAVLEELVLAAVSDALSRVRIRIQEEMTQKMGLVPPGLFPGVV